MPEKEKTMKTAFTLALIGIIFLGVMNIALSSRLKNVEQSLSALKQNFSNFSAELNTLGLDISKMFNSFFNYEVSEVEWINPAASVDMDGMNLYRQSDNLYFSADNNAKISLYVQAEIDSDGKFTFDDGQDWLLVMETSFGDYLLFPRQRLQLGIVEYMAYNGDSGNAYDIFHV